MSSHPIVVRDLTVSFRHARVLGGIDVSVAPGQRVALIGENGRGKSTLLRAIAGTLPGIAEVHGSIERPKDLVWLAQEPTYRDTDTIASVLASSLKPLHDAVAVVEHLAGSLDDPATATRYAEALEYAVAHDAWDADRRAALASERLGLRDLSPERQLATLSGGQRARLALASAITRRPDALLLDEPTNHLDDEATEALTEFLLDLPGPLLFASHDRVLLDDLATDLIDLEPTEYGTDGHGGRRFGGGWTAYQNARSATQARWEQTYGEQQDELKRLGAAARIGTEAIAHNRGPRDNDKFIYGFKGAKVDRSLARRKRDAQRRLEVAQRSQIRKPPPQLRFSTPLGAVGSTGRIVTVRDLVVADRLRLAHLDVHSGEHLLVTGPNGVGKSTLLGALSGRLTPSGGSVEVTARRVAELVQDPVFPNPHSSASLTFRNAVGGALAEERPLAQLGLVHGSDLNRPVGTLSVGQRRRLALAIAIATGPDLLLLDEPTNHISLSLADELEEAVASSRATIVVASHDRWLRARWHSATVALTFHS